MKYIGLEIGGTKLQAALGTPSGRIERMERAVADSSGGADAILRQLATLVRPLLESSDVVGLGIGFGGPVDEETGRTIKSHQVPGWENRPLASWAQQSFGISCRVANDTDLAALAEAVLGAGKNHRRVFYTNIGSGIGGGLVDDGRLFTGRGGAMEFGHTWSYSCLTDDDRLENICSGWALARRARNMAAGYETSKLAGYCAEEPDEKSAAPLFAAWLAGCPVAELLVDDFSDCYARALADLVALVNPDVIVIGGGVSQVGEPLLNAIRASIPKYVYSPFAENFTIKIAEVGQLAVPLGAILLAATENADRRAL